LRAGQGLKAELRAVSGGRNLASRTTVIGERSRTRAGGGEWLIESISDSLVPRFRCIFWTLSCAVEQEGGIFNPGAPGWSILDFTDHRIMYSRLMRMGRRQAAHARIRFAFRSVAS
jgi:hypothetical protein